MSATGNLRRRRLTGRHSAAFVALAIAATGCVPLLFDDSCGPESRVQTTSAPLRDQAGNILGSATFTLSESRGNENSRDFQLVFMGPRDGSHGGPLKGQVTAVVLTEAAGVMRFDIPVLPPSLYGDEITRPSGMPLDDDVTTFSLLRRAALEGRLRVHLEMTPGTTAVEDVSFPAAAPGDWNRAHCS
jgi:hypothetical protein